jgi:hypothetical protein
MKVVSVDAADADRDMVRRGAWARATLLSGPRLTLVSLDHCLAMGGKLIVMLPCLFCVEND